MSFVARSRSQWAGLVQRYGLSAWGGLLLKVVISLAILELGTRGALAFKSFLDRDLPLCYDYVTTRCRTPEYYAELDDVIRFESVAGVSHRSNYRGQWINTNAQGFRGTVDYGEKKPGTLRIVVVGGSAVWGPFIHDDETIPAYLQKELEKRLNQPVEVINAGVTAERSSEELLRILVYILPLRPDVVIVYDGRNDLYFSSSPNWSATKTPAVQTHEALEQQKQDAAFVGLMDQAWQAGITYSKFLSTLNVLHRVWSARQQAQVQSASSESVSSNGASALAEAAQAEIEANALKAYQVNLQRIALLLKSENVLPIFVLQAILQPGAKPAAPEEEVILSRMPPSVQRVLKLYPLSQEFFKTFSAEQEGIIALDYTNVFAGVPEQMYFDDVHYLPSGNASIARHLADDVVAALERQGVIHAVHP